MEHTSYFTLIIFVTFYWVFGQLALNVLSEEWDLKGSDVAEILKCKADTGLPSRRVACALGKHIIVISFSFTSASHTISEQTSLLMRTWGNL